MIVFLSGLLVMGYAVAAVFFGRFWRDTRDRLFLYFSAGFALLAVQRAALALAVIRDLPTTAYHVLRLMAFLLILAAIVHKNRQPNRRGM